MEQPSALPRPADMALRQFRARYLAYCAGLTALTVLVVAWFWSQPTPYALGVPFQSSLPILLVASMLSNGISFFFQDRYVRRLLASNGAEQLNVGRFTARFYLYNLLTAAVLSVLLYYPLVLLLFFFAPYPIITWLVPYHAIFGYLLGRELRRYNQK